MNGQEQKEGFFVEDYLEIFLRRKWLIIIPLILGLAGAGAALLIIPPAYKSTTVILVEPQKVPSAYVKSTVDIDIQDRLATMTQQVMSRSRLEPIIKEFGLYENQREHLSNEEVVDLMRNHIEIEVKGDRNRKDSFTISYQNSNPETAMNVTNKLASLFIEENLKVREQQAEGTTQFLDAQLQEVKTTLEEQEAKLRTFKQQYMGELPSQLETNLRTLDRLQLDLQATNEVLRLAEDRRATLERQIMESNPLKGRLDALRAELVRLEGEYTGKYPEVSRLQAEIQTLEKNLADEKAALDGKSTYRPSNQDHVSQSLAGQYRDLGIETGNLREKRSELIRQIKTLQVRVERTPGREQQLSSLIRDYENTKNNYESLLAKKLDAQLSENLEKRQKGEQFRILDPANFPEKPFQPVPLTVLLIGLAAGVGAGGGLVFLLEYLDSSFRKTEDLYRSTGLPVLAALPIAETRGEISVKRRLLPWK